MFKKNSLIVIVFVLLFFLTIFLLFKYKPIKSDIVYLNEKELSEYLEGNSVKDQLIMLSKNNDIYEIGYLKIPNMGFSKYSPIIRIKKKDIEINNIDKIKINQIFYNDSCHKLIVFKNQLEENKTRLNYRNKNYSSKDKKLCDKLLKSQNIRYKNDKKK